MIQANDTIKLLPEIIRQKQTTTKKKKFGHNDKLVKQQWLIFLLYFQMHIHYF